MKETFLFPVMEIIMVRTDEPLKHATVNTENTVEAKNPVRLIMF